MYPGEQQISVYGNAANQQAQQPRETTRLEELLQGLQILRDRTQGALNRASQLGDRLLGPEPSSTAKPSAGIAGTGEPPMVHRLKLTAEDINQLVEALHHNLNRLERL